MSLLVLQSINRVKNYLSFMTSHHVKDTNSIHAIGTRVLSIRIIVRRYQPLEDYVYKCELFMRHSYYFQ